MEGYKQCLNPECRCTDVPIDAKNCPFCGYIFVEKTETGSAKKQNTAVVKEPEEKKLSEGTGISEMKVEGTSKETENQSSVTEGTTKPKPTEYTTYKKKGLKKQAVSGTAQKEQVGRGAIGWLAAALMVAVLYMANRFIYQMTIRSFRGEYLVWSCIVSGAMYGFLHACLFANEKGSRRAGVLGIVLGAVGLLCLMAYVLYDRGLTLSQAFSYAFQGSSLGRSVLISSIIYFVCWLTAAKLAKNSKGFIAFCLTAAELLLLPYLANWMLYQTRPQILNWQFAVLCAAMLVTDFLLFCIKTWLAVKLRKLFWVFYAIVIVVALVSMYGSRYLLI